MSTTDYSSIYSIKDFYQKEILPLYFDDDELALSSVGALGMFLDITGTTTEDMINIMGRYINESMPGKAELPDFIYGNAANYGITSIFAQPAKMSMLLLVKEANVIEYATTVEDHLEFTLDSDMSILVDDLQYSIPYNIKIRSTLYNGEYNHMAFYDVDHVNSIASEDVPFIKTMKTLINGDIWLVMRVSVYQYERSVVYETINTNSILNIPYVDLTFTDQLCNLEVFYSEAGSTTETQLTKKMDTSTALTSPFCFYKLTSDNTVRISFANDDRYWVPSYNSTLRIYVYTTNGSKGNFGFFKDGIDVSIRATTEDESIAYNRNIFPMGLTQGNSVSGRDQLTLEDIKLLTSEAQITVKSYTTDNDLRKYFTNFASIYDHDAVFVKQRDDYASREYGCFTMVGDGTDIFPTNTLDIRLAVTDTDEHFESLRQYMVKPGTVFHYEDDTTGSIVTRKHEGDVDEEIEYALSSLMVITTKPNKVNYYMNTVDKDVEVDYTYFNLNSPLNFVVNSLNIRRDAIHGEDDYTITLSLARVDGVFNDIQSEDFQLQSSNGEIDTTRMEVLIVINTTTGNYVRMTYDHSENIESDYIYTFTATIGTTDMIDDERILLTRLSKREDDSEDERLVDMMSPDLQFGIFYNYADQTGGDHNFTDIQCVKEHTLCNIYTPQEEEFYFAYPLNLIRSHVVFEDKPETDDGFGFYIKQVPFFGADFLMSDECDIDQILTDISDEHYFLSQIVSSLHGMFTINMKFFCTYGRGRNFYIGCGESEEVINRINCDIAMGIKFYTGIIQDDYLEEVRIYIKEFVEKINKLTSGTNQAFISLLSQKLHNNFADQIEYVIFYSINGYDSKYQVIRTITDMDDNTDPDFVPEYLTLKTSDVVLTTL
jgi:hypothetical protein